jgi:methyltransferase (TIGR00027 family)
MKLPNLSYMMSVGELRYIQSRFEKGAAKNPDGLVGGFLPWSKRLSCWVRGALLLPKLRANPFYAYLNARTKYYDQVFGGALERSITRIVNIGCGSDTRAQRFAEALRAHRVEVLECDQEPAIRAKEQLARRLWGTSDHVEYLPLDLEAGAWPALEAWLGRGPAAPTLVMLEGVSPYVRQEAFAAFLRLLSSKLHPASALAYDFKLRGVADDFGGAPGSGRFRLSADRDEVTRYHRDLGFVVDHMELSSALSQRLQPGPAALFEEDCLLRLSLLPAGLPTGA